MPVYSEQLLCAWCSNPGFPKMVETVSLRTMTNVSKSRLKALDSRIRVPEGKNCFGTKVRGKIVDRDVDIRP